MTRLEYPATGRWQSEDIDVAIGMEGILATVYTREGERQLREGEVTVELARARAELADLRRQVERLRGKNT